MSKVDQVLAVLGVLRPSPHRPKRVARSLAVIGSVCALTAAAAPTVAPGAPTQDATFATRSLTPETALAAARAALEHCRNLGYQVSVAVVDRNGLTQVLLRDRFAGPHTVDVAPNKAWTAASFRISTGVLATETQTGKPMSALRGHPRVLAAAGGLVIEAGGSMLGAIGVSGAPGGEADEDCAKAGIKAIADAIELS